MVGYEVTSDFPFKGKEAHWQDMVRIAFIVATTAKLLFYKDHRL